MTNTSVKAIADKDHKQLSRGASLDMSSAAIMRRLEGDIGREAVTVLGRALKAKIRPNVELVPIAGLRSEDVR